MEAPGAGLPDVVGQKVDVGVGKIFILSTFCPQFIKYFNHNVDMGVGKMWALDRVRQNVDVGMGKC